MPCTAVVRCEGSIVLTLNNNLDMSQLLQPENVDLNSKLVVLKTGSLDNTI